MASVLFTQEEFENYIGKAIKVDDYTRAEEYARGLIQEYCQRDFISATYTDEQHDADTRYVELDHRPVSSVTSVVTDFWDDDTTSETIDQEYYHPRAWGVEVLKVYSADYYKITYVGGETSVPRPIKEVALGIGKQLVIESDLPEPQVSSISSGGVSYSFRTADWIANKPTRNDEWNAILNAYATRQEDVRIL